MGSDWTKDFGFAREEIFRSEETLRTIRHIRASWGGEPEFLWEKFPVSYTHLTLPTKLEV